MNRKTLFVIMAAVLMVSLAAAGALAMGFGRVRMGHFVNNEDVKAAIESDNSQITKENFDKIVEMHQEMQSNNSTMTHKVRSFGRGHHKIKIIE